jgi:arylsulfatase A-like enzyme
MSATTSRRAFLGSLPAAASLLRAQTAARPNIVYILADDLGWGDLGCYNRDSLIPTPNADRLASQGVRFTDMHSPSSVCTPTRYGIMTGRYCWRTRLKSGVLQGYAPNLIEPGRMTVASMLRERGYYTACAGKWHLGLGDQERADYSKPLKPCPNDHGFDYSFIIPSSLDFEPYLYVENGRATQQPTAKTEGRNDPRGVFWRPGAIAPSFRFEEVLPTFAAKAVSIIRDRAKRPSQPFYLYLPLPAPHTPWMPTKEWNSRSKAGIYGDFAAMTDDVVGQVMRALEQTGAAANTLLVFTSDNGAHWTPQDKALFPHRSNGHWRGMKADVWDAGHRIPFLARWPGRIPAGSVSNELGCLTDFLATAAAAVETRLPDGAGEDSFNLLPAYQGRKQAAPIREAVVHHSSQGLFAIRQGSWKLILGRGSGGFSEPRTYTPKPGEPEGELYNMADDPSEERNLYQSEPARVKSMTALLAKYQQSGRSR